MSTDMKSESNPNQNLSTDEWWSKKRPLYNLGLILAGCLAWALFFISFSLPTSSTNTIDSPFVFIVGYPFFYGVAMIFANLLYYLGPLSERIVKPVNPNRFRVIMFNLGLWFSVLLPISIPSFAIIKSLFSS